MTAPTHVSPSLISTLPGLSYTDPELFQREQEKIFEARWTAAARSADLDGTGAFRTLDVGRENVILVRGRDRQLRAFLNVCRHRGARVCMERSGVARRNIQCGYHAWTYGLDGKLVAAPNLTQMPDLDRTAYGLVPVPVREWLGYAWVCVADEPPSFEDTVIGAVTERLGGAGIIEGWDIENLEVVECEWLYLPEVVRTGHDLDRSVELFHRVNQQDFDACERCQLAATSKAYAQGGVLVPSEHHIGAFHTRVTEQLAM